MRKGEEQDTELGMLTHTWAKLEVGLFCFGSDLAYILLPLRENSHVGLGQAKKAKLLLFMAEVSFDRPKRILDQSPFSKRVWRWESNLSR